MAQQRQLTNAPVREALVDSRFESKISLELVDRFLSMTLGTYGNRRDLWEAMFSFGDGGEGATGSSSSAVGRRLESKDNQFVLQVRVSGFTLSRLSPYGEWNDLRAEAQRLWTSLLELAGDIVVNRIAVRYINEIKLQLPVADFSKFLTSPPVVPASLPQGITGFLTRVIIPDLNLDCVSIVTQALEAPPSEGPSGASITVLLDIDVFRLRRCNALDVSIWQTLDVLREQKNRMFFEHLTETTVEMYA